MAKDLHRSILETQIGRQQLIQIILNAFEELEQVHKQDIPLEKGHAGSASTPYLSM